MKFGKRFKKIALKTLRFAHNVTHKGPIGKLHDMVAKAVPKPFDVFVKIGTSSSDQIHKLMVKAHILRKSDITSGHSQKGAAIIREEARKHIEKHAARGNHAAQKALAALNQLDTMQVSPGRYRINLNGKIWDVRG